MEVTEEFERACLRGHAHGREILDMVNTNIYYMYAVFNTCIYTVPQLITIIATCIWFRIGSHYLCIEPKLLSSQSSCKGEQQCHRIHFESGIAWPPCTSLFLMMALE